MLELLARLIAWVASWLGRGTRAPQIQGRWEPDPASLPKGLTAEQMATVSAMIMKVSLEFNADRTYTYTMSGGGQNARFEGVYALRGRTATMTTISLNGIDSKSLIQGVASDFAPTREGPMPTWRGVLSADSHRLSLNDMVSVTKFVRAE